MTLSADAALNSAVRPEEAAARKADYPIADLILNRWSPRAYADRPVADEELFTVLEAARWAPSSSNEQPWRFYVARTEAELERFRSFILPGNRKWADRAPVLLLLASAVHKSNGDANGAHAFDAGAAWGILALQARLLGLATRAIGGFDRRKARETLRTPDGIELHAVIALGHPGTPDLLPEELREREKPNSRRPLKDSLLPVPLD